MKTVFAIVLVITTLAGIAAANDVPAVAPEISGGSAVSAIGLLGGALLLMRARRKK